MTQVGILQTIQVGKPKRYSTSTTPEKAESPWSTSFFRRPDPQPRWLHLTYLEGNEQADKKNHGQPGQTVLLYSAAHYPLWQTELSRPEISNGGFGENFTVQGLDEQTVCIGDIYALGEAQIQVTGPRYPCWKIERRWQHPGLTELVAATGRTGWYCSVLHEGLITPVMPVHLVERPYPRWTIALTNDFGHQRNKNLPLAQQLATCPLLDIFWRRLIVEQARK